MTHFLVFGTHPRLSLAEFRCIKKRDQQKQPPLLCGSAALIEDDGWDGAALMNLLGGTVKLGDIVYEGDLESCTGEQLADLLLAHPRAPRIVFGCSVYGGSSQGHKRFQKIPLETKRALTTRGHSVRWVTSDQGEGPSPAAIAKLQLIKDGYDLNLFIHEDKISVGLTTHVQDADAWSTRDYGRPVRDDENGMLPPKLARMMVNLASIGKNATVIDPFCGSGTVLMEAALATHAKRIIGSDIEEEQTQATKKNLAWLLKQHILRPDDESRFEVFTSDVRTLERHLSIQKDPIDGVVTEGYLGPLLRGNESQQALEKAATSISELWIQTFEALAPLLKKDARLVCVWPAFKTSHGTARVDLSSHHLFETTYELLNPLEGWETDDHPLLYYRPDQRIMRRIVVIKKR